MKKARNCEQNGSTWLIAMSGSPSKPTGIVRRTSPANQSCETVSATSAASQRDKETPSPEICGKNARRAERMRHLAVTRMGGVYFDIGLIVMTAGDEYRGKAVEFHAKAQVENDPKQKAEFENLARAYVRLAEQAERNSHLDVTYETPVTKDDDPKLKP
jgi:hypothetical protein